MPTYEYECETCHHQFEVRQKFSDPPVKTCGKCGNGVRKLISAPGIMFKGTGWYVTDYSDKLKDPNRTPPSEGSEKGSEKSEKDGAKSGERAESPSAKREPGTTAPPSSSSPSSPSSSPPANAAPSPNPTP